MSACSTFTEHVWKPGECKNCFKPKSLHCLAQSSGGKPPSEQRPPAIQQQIRPPAGARANTNLAVNSQRSGSDSAHSGHFRPPVAKKPTIAVKPTMMLPCSSAELDSDRNLQRPLNMDKEQGKTSAFTVWNRNGLNHKRPGGPSNNNNEREDGNDETESYGQLSPKTPSGNNNNSGLTDVLKEIAGLSPGPSITPLSGSKDLFWGRISSSYQRSLERGLPASSCLAMGSSSSGGTAQKRVSLSDSSEIISTEGGRFCYPDFSSEGEDDEEEEDEDEETERDDDEHESWDESDEELLAMEIRMRGQPRFSNFRAATLSPVPFAAGKKWNTVPLRNRSLQRICAVDYDDSYDEILNGYPSMDSNGALLPYERHDIQGSVFLSNSESTTSPESSSSLPEDSRTTSSSGNSATCAVQNSLHSPKSPKAPLPCTSPQKNEPVHRALSPLKVTETHKAVLAIRLEDQDGRDGASMPQAIPGQPVTISFSPTEEQAKPYRIVNLEKSLVCKPYTVVDVSASMANKHEQSQDSTPKPQNLSSMPSSPMSFCHMPLGQPLSPTSPLSPSSPVTSTSPTSVALSGTPRKKLGNIRYQEVWTSNTSPRQKIAKVDLGVGTNPCPSIPTQHYSHKSAPTSPIAGLSSSRTVPVKSSNLSEIKFNSFNNAGMPPFPIIIRDEPAYARSSKNAVKVPIVINPSAYDNLAVYKSFLGLSGELPQPKGGGSRIASHTYEEIGSSESVQTSSTEKTISGRGTSERASFEEIKAPSEALSKTPNLQPRTTTDSSTAISTVMRSTVGALSTNTSASSPAILAISANQHKTSAIANAVTPTCQTNGDATCSKGDNTDSPLSSEAVVSHREEASAVLLEIVAAIQPPRSPPESPSAQANSEELYSLPPDAMKDTLTRHKTLFSTTDGCLSKPKKDTPSKVLSKSQSASAAVPLSSPRSEPNLPTPPPRSTSSPYHASNILQRHFGNWTKSSASNSPVRPSESETSPGGEGRRISTESSKPKRWISFKSFFRRRKDEDEQREKVEREKDKAKLVGLDGTVIHMLPPPPVQQHHWFTEAKPEDPTQKPTIIFTYKPESTPCDGEGELQVEECRENVPLTLSESKESSPLYPEQTPTSHTTGSDLITKALSQAPVISSDAGDRGLLTNSSLPLKVNLGHTLGEGEEGCANQVATPASASEGSASIGEPEDDGSHSHHSHSPASGQCSATYTNLGQSRANMIPMKQPRNIKASSDTLASTDLDILADQPAPKATPPPLPKKAVPRSSTEPSLGGKESVQGGLRPRAEARPGGTNLSVANPIYDLDSTWETASQSSSLSSEFHRVHDHESGDSLERQKTTVIATNKGRLTNSVSSLVPQPAPAAPSATTSRERRAYPSAESLAGRGRAAGQGFAAGGSKLQRPALYRGLDSWDEVVGRIRGLHTDTLRKLATKCEDRFMAGQKDHLRFGTDSWSHFRLTTGKPCCEAGDAVYYTASYAKDPLVNYAIKICRGKVKETQQQFFHSLAVRQSLAVHFNIQQDYGHFLADVPARLLPWEEEEQEEDEEDVDRLKEKEIKTDTKATDSKASNGKLDESPTAGHMNTGGHLRSRVVVITHEVPFQTVADFVREGVLRHTHNPELYERQVCLLLLQLCSGLEHMKPYHVTHCDLRLENLLLVHCQRDSPWNPDIVEPNNTSNSGSAGATAAGASATSATCPARLIISNFSQAKQKSTLMAADPSTLRDQSRLAPEIVTATQYRKCDEFQTGILIYEMLHQPNPFEETPELKEREYTWADLPPLPVRSLYSQGLQQLARLLLTVNPSERIRMSEARACLQCLLWGPREDLFQALGCSNMGPMSGATSNQREVTLQNWLDLKRTLMMIKFAERSLDAACGVSLEDWLCCQYLAFATTDTLSRVVQILWHPQPHPQSQNQSQTVHAAPSQTPAHQTHTLHLTQSQPL